MDEYVPAGLEDLWWNSLRLPRTSIHFLYIIPLTTELRVLVPQVDLGPVGAQAPEVRNEYSADPIAQMAIDPRASLPESVWVPGLDVEMVEGLFEVNTAAVIPTEPTDDSVWSAAQVPDRPPQTATNLLQELSNSDMEIPQIANEMGAFPGVSNSLSEASAPLGRRERLQLVVEELSREIQKRGEQIESGLLQVAQQVSTAITPLITPPPRRAFGAVPVRVRGSAPHRGAIRTVGGVGEESSHLRGIVLNEAWKPEGTLSLPIEEGPEILEGRFTLTLRGEDAALIGRRADLLLKSERVEIALGSAKIGEVEGEEQWRLAFDLDLAAAGLKVKEGTLSPRVLQVVIEPAQGPAKGQSKRAT
jgi:hypothetical protein